MNMHEFFFFKAQHGKQWVIFKIDCMKNVPAFFRNNNILKYEPIAWIN